MTFSEQSEIKLSFSIKEKANGTRDTQKYKTLTIEVDIIDRNDEIVLLGRKHENIATLLINNVVDNLSLSSWKKEMNNKLIDLSTTVITFALKKERYIFYFDLTNLKRERYKIHIVPDENTIKNVQAMIQRSLQFLRECGDVVEYDFKFPCHKKKDISKNFGNFMTADTIWKVHASNVPPNKSHFIWLLRQYIIGKRLNNPELSSIKNLGIFHARFNKLYILKIEDIPAPVIDLENKKVIKFIERYFSDPKTPKYKPLAN